MSHVLDERATDFSRERLDRLHQADNIWLRHDCDSDAPADRVLGLSNDHQV